MGGGCFRRHCARVCVEALTDADGVLVIEETGFLKQGKGSRGVGRQYTGSAGKITNCQVGVFAAYASRRGHALVDRALYLPRDWARDPVRLAGAHVPDGVGFAAKPRLAPGMVGRQGSWGALRLGDCRHCYGTGELEISLRRAGKGYVLGAPASQLFTSWLDKPEAYGTAEEIAQGLAASPWRRLSAGAGTKGVGTKGARLCDWACLELAGLKADEFNPALSGIQTRGLLTGARLPGRVR
jgi:SRSO17 transposase